MFVNQRTLIEYETGLDATDDFGLTPQRAILGLGDAQDTHR